MLGVFLEEMVPGGSWLVRVRGQMWRRYASRSSTICGVPAGRENSASQRKAECWVWGGRRGGDVTVDGV